MKILIVDDHPIVRQGLAALLVGMEPGTRVLEAGSVADAYAAASAHDDLDLVVLDLMIPDVSGLAALAGFRQVRPEVPVIVLSSSESPKDVRMALAEGALGYVPKSASHQTLLAATRLVMSGETYIPPLLLNEPLVDGGADRGGKGEARLTLTERQIEVLGRISRGQPNKIIAHELNLSEKTVKAHITAIFKVLDVVNRTQAAAAGRAQGLIPSE